MFEPLQEGYDAYYEGKKFSECPYSTVGIEGPEWQNGWLRAAEENQPLPPLSSDGRNARVTRRFWRVDVDVLVVLLCPKNGRYYSMFPCCDYCYKKYINADGTIDMARLELIVKTDKQFEGDPCKCPCHKDGIEVMH